MSEEGTHLSNPFSTGGGGTNFERHVQAGFVVLMLTGGVVPCVGPWPVKKIKLQGRYDGYNTDDFIAFTEEPGSARKAKLLAQIKHSLSITANDPTFAKVIGAAWRDFQDKELFDQTRDAIALITGPMSASDIEHARPLLEWARTSANAQEFFDKVKLGRFSSVEKQEKLAAFRTQLQKANTGVDVSDEELWLFLKSFHILGYDLDIRSGVTLSLLHSHIAQFAINNVQELWASVADEVGYLNQNAGTITIETLSEETRLAFSARNKVETIPAHFLPQKPPPPPANFAGGKEVEAIMYAALLGAWNDKSDGDKGAIKRLIEGND